MVFGHGDLINNIRLRGQHQCKSFRLTSKMQILQERKLVFDPTSTNGNRWPPHRTPTRIKVPLNVSKSPLLNCLYGPNCLKLTTSALDMPNRHGGSPAALAPSGKSASKRRCGNKCSHRPNELRISHRWRERARVATCLHNRKRDIRAASELAREHVRSWQNRLVRSRLYQGEAGACKEKAAVRAIRQPGECR